jgi:hypothetical protein
LIQDDEYHDVKHLRVLKFIDIGEGKEHNNQNQIITKAVEDDKEKAHDENGITISSRFLIRK